MLQSSYKVVTKFLLLCKRTKLLISGIHLNNNRIQTYCNDRYGIFSLLKILLYLQKITQKTCKNNSSI